MDIENSRVFIKGKTAPSGRVNLEQVNIKMEEPSFDDNNDEEMPELANDMPIKEEYVEKRQTEVAKNNRVRIPSLNETDSKNVGVKCPIPGLWLDGKFYPAYCDVPVNDKTVNVKQEPSTSAAKSNENLDNSANATATFNCHQCTGRNIKRDDVDSQACESKPRIYRKERPSNTATASTSTAIQINPEVTENSVVAENVLPSGIPVKRARLMTSNSNNETINIPENLPRTNNTALALGTRSIDLFFMSMCETTKSLPSPLQLQIKRKVFEVVFEAEEIANRIGENFNNEGGTFDDVSTLY